MIKLLAKIFIKNNNDFNNPQVRRHYGILCGAVGIVLNIFLFCGKLFAGFIAKSVAITADAFNNLSDAGSSIISMIGFKMAGKKPDAEHPFGHGRIEYISGLIVSMLIILMGFELASSSINNILNPEKTDYSLLSLIILCVSILVKIYMIIYNKNIGNKISSPTMKATAADSLSDVISSCVVLLTVLVTVALEKYFNIQLSFSLDGFAGLAVSIFIFYSGFSSAKETLEPLLGTAPSKELVENIEKTVLTHEQIIGIHDLVIHDYGPGRLMISLHAEVSSKNDFFEIHDVIDNIEVEIANKFSCDCVIHMDPIETDNEPLNQMKSFVKDVVQNINSELTIDDFSFVPGNTHTNLIFDIVLESSFIGKEEELKTMICTKIKEKNHEYNCVIKFDLKYV
jgi:cation diffusion facilitator family transporter